MNKIKTILSILLLSALLLSCQDKTDSSVKNNDISLTKINEIKLPEEKETIFEFPEKSLFIDLNGNNINEGSAEKPYKTLEHALKQCRGGETLFLRGGRYRLNLFLKSFGQNFSEQVEVRNYPGEEVIIDGSEDLSPKWSLWKNGIYRAKLNKDCWQLFSDDNLVYVARWPDASFEDGSIWRMTQSTKSIDGGYRKGKFTGPSRLGLAYDKMFKNTDGEGFHEGDSRYSVGQQPESLADSGLDISDQLAVLNIGHWLTWARPVKSHIAGTGKFTYDIKSIRQDDMKAYGTYYVLGLKVLDRPNEWWFDKDKRTVYYMPPTGEEPENMNLKMKTQDFAINLMRSKALKFRGLKFFATGVNAQSCKDLVFEDCHFDYASTNKFILGGYNWFGPSNKRSNSRALSFNGGRGTKIINCEFRRNNAPVFLCDDKMLIENCSFEDIEWDVNSNGGSGSIVLGEGSIIIRCTVNRTGNSEGIRPIKTNCVIELNRLTDMGNLQHDGAAINVGTAKQKGVLVQNNWVHDSNRQGIRFDYHGTNVHQKDGSVYGDGIYSNNVTWNTQPNQVKGDRHLILNNTVINSNRYTNAKDEKFNMSIQGFRAMHEVLSNEHSVTRNNLANLTHRSWNLENSKKNKVWTIRKDGYKVPRARVLPGVNDHNMKEAGAAFEYLRDPQNWDFRPQDNSPLVEGGKELKKDDIKSKFINYVPSLFIGKKPDIGAYEFGDKNYWIPGRKKSQASIPIPINGGKAVSLDQDLMYLGAYKADAHYVYFGEEAESLKLLAEHKNEMNIFTPAYLKENKKYYWRVDAYVNGRIISGKLWSFKTKNK